MKIECSIINIVSIFIISFYSLEKFEFNNVIINLAINTELL
jgi:hypothetical protein